MIEPDEQDAAEQLRLALERYQRAVQEKYRRAMLEAREARAELRRAEDRARSLGWLDSVIAGRAESQTSGVSMVLSIFQDREGEPLGIPEVLAAMKERGWTTQAQSEGNAVAMFLSKAVCVDDRLHRVRRGTYVWSRTGAET